MKTPNEETPRSIELEVEVPGTPEQVWDAIATGPGITAWFAPAEIAEHEGGPVAFDMGSGMEESGVVTTWDPPRRFAYEEEWQALEDAPPGRLATEWIVEARSGGVCVVRVVSSLFASGEDWEQELENTREGWRVYLQNLRLYLTHFPGQRCHSILVLGSTTWPKDRAWSALTGALGLPDALKGERVATSPASAPPLAGVVEERSDVDHGRGLMLRLDEPAPGAAMIAIYTYAGQAFASVHAYLFGDDAPAGVARDAPRWHAWMEEHFPSADAKAESGAASG